MKFSIIVPVHNAEEYLLQCIDSIFNQEISDFEVIFIVNGSNDGSEDICLTAREYHSNIRVIVTDAVGVSFARNIGLREARGEYVVFADADDELLKGALSAFADAMTGRPDIITANYIRDKKRKMTGQISDVPTIPYALAMLDAPAYFRSDSIRLTWQPLVLYSVFAKAFRRDFLTKSSISFDTDLAIGEDFMFSLKAVLAADSIRSCDRAVYYYRPGAQTVSNAKDISGVSKRLVYAGRLYDTIGDLPPEIQNAARMKVIDIVLRSIVIGAGCESGRQEAFDAVRTFLTERKLGSLFAHCRKGSLSIVSPEENICYMKMIESLRQGKLSPAFKTAENYNVYMQKKDVLKRRARQISPHMIKIH